MDVVSTYKFARISARKARDVAREIQGLPVSAALDILNFTPRKGADLFAKTMKTALADAENNFELPIEELMVKEATVGEGPTFRRYKPRARGSAAPVRKRTSHIRVVLTDEVVEEEPKEARQAKRKPKQQQKQKQQKPKAEKTAKTDESKKSGKSDGKESRVDDEKGLIYDSAPSDADDLTEIKGVGPKLAEKLNSEGIYTFEQIANWTDDQVEAFDELLSFKGRIERDEWVKLAKELADEK